MRKESYELRQRLTDAEAVRESLRKDLTQAQGRLNELEAEIQVKSREFEQVLEENKEDTQVRLSQSVTTLVTSVHTLTSTCTRIIRCILV